VALVMAEHGLSQRHACKLLAVDRSTYRYEPRPDHNAKLRTALLELARQKPRFGYRRLWVLLTTRQGLDASIGGVHRL
jgi:putative transposase